MEIQEHILYRNRKQSLQSLATPFMSSPQFAKAINPIQEGGQLDLSLSGQFTEQDLDLSQLNEVQKEWILSLLFTKKS